MPSILLRPAVASDVIALPEIFRSANRAFAAVGHPELADEDVPADWLERVVADARITVAVAGDVVVGWLATTRIDGELCLAQVSVSPHHGRQGVGTALVRDLIARAIAAGEQSIVLNTQSDVPWNAPWYSRLGFVVVPEDRWTDGMREITVEQRADGLDWSGRVHMRLVPAEALEHHL